MAINKRRAAPTLQKEAKQLTILKRIISTIIKEQVTFSASSEFESQVKALMDRYVGEAFPGFPDMGLVIKDIANDIISANEIDSLEGIKDLDNSKYGQRGSYFLRLLVNKAQKDISSGTELPSTSVVEDMYEQIKADKEQEQEEARPTNVKNRSTGSSLDADTLAQYGGEHNYRSGRGLGT